MSQSNLALLDRVVEGAVAYELGDGTHDEAALKKLGIAPKRSHTVAGLKVITNATRDVETSPAATKLLDDLMSYRANRTLVTDKLARVGVTPLAVLPVKAWERICDAKGLYRFCPRGDKVRISGKGIIERAKRLSRRDGELPEEGERLLHQRNNSLAFCATSFLMVVLSLIVAIVTHGEDGGELFMHFPVVFFACAVVAFGRALHKESSKDRVRRKHQEHREAEHIRTLVSKYRKNGTLMKRLWPDYKEPAKKDAQADIRILLPEPPKAVQDKLAGAARARLPLHVAAVPEAIGFKENPANALIGVRRKYWKEMERLAARDPIVYTIEGNAVAIIDQYGDFPIEQEVINEVVNSEYLA